jgi:hypothetical protein
MLDEELIRGDLDVQVASGDPNDPYHIIYASAGLRLTRKPQSEIIRRRANVQIGSRK